MRGRQPLVIHYVYDMQRARDFYASVFDVNTLFESPGWSTLDFQSFELALHILHTNLPPISLPPNSAPDSAGEGPIPHAGLNLLVDNIEEMQALIESGGGTMTELREPDDFVPVRVASFADTEGNGFELRQEV